LPQPNDTKTFLLKINFILPKLKKTPGVVFTKTSFSLKLKNGPSKLEFYITLDWKGLQLTNT
jgi:hypothetical protein